MALWSYNWTPGALPNIIKYSTPRRCPVRRSWCQDKIARVLHIRISYGYHTATSRWQVGAVVGSNIASVLCQSQVLRQRQDTGAKSDLPSTDVGILPCAAAPAPMAVTRRCSADGTTRLRLSEVSSAISWRCHREVCPHIPHRLNMKRVTNIEKYNMQG